MRVVYFLITIITFNLHAATLKLSKAIHQAETTPFLAHSSPSKFGSYLIMNLPYGPMRNFLEQVGKLEGVKLKTRGEAHITVVTPVEFSQILAPAGVSIDEISEIAQNEQIQSSRFETICLGRGNLKNMSTYFIVIKSPKLESIRESIHKLFVQKGGLPTSFNTKKFYPHITVGFTERDLHESDGVIKDSSSCIANIEEF